MDATHVASEIEILVAAIREHGTPGPDGKLQAPFGVLYEATQDTLEALNGTLRAAKKQGVIAFTKQMLLKGPDDKEIITLLTS